MSILRFITGGSVSAVTPTHAASVPALSAMKVLLADGTYLTGLELQAAVGVAAVTATGATISGAPASGTTGTAITGVTDTLTPSNATAYASLTIAGTEQAPRTGFTGTSVPILTPATAGATTIGIYAAASGGVALVSSASFTVSGAVVVPGQVTGLTVGTLTSTTIPLTWTAPASGGTPASYDVTYTPSGGTATTVNTASTVLSYTVTGRTASTVHSVTVAARNAAGVGTASAAVSATTTAASSFATFTLTPINLAPPTTGSSGGVPNSFFGAGGQVRFVCSDAVSAPTVVYAYWTKSNTVTPTASGATGSTATSVDSQYGNHNSEVAPGNPVGTLANFTFQFDGLVLWTHSVPAGNYYLWADVTGPDGHRGSYCMSSAPCVVS